MRQEILPISELRKAMAVKARRRGQDWNAIFALQLHMAHIAGWEREYMPFKPRRFRVDFAWLVERLLVELHGGVWALGPQAHSWGTGIKRDHDKRDLAAAQGWTLREFTGDEVRDFVALHWVQGYLDAWVAQRRGEGD